MNRTTPRSKAASSLTTSKVPASAPAASVPSSEWGITQICMLLILRCASCQLAFTPVAFPRRDKRTPSGELSTSDGPASSIAPETQRRATILSIKGSVTSHTEASSRAVLVPSHARKISSISEGFIPPVNVCRRSDPQRIVASSRISISTPSRLLGRRGTLNCLSKRAAFPTCSPLIIPFILDTPPVRRSPTLGAHLPVYRNGHRISDSDQRAR